MKRTWFRHHDLTTEEADELIHRYTLRNSNTEAALCAGCARVLDDDEVHICGQCSKEFTRRGADESAKGSKM